MECHQCLQSGISREAVGLCHHCSAALCAEHIWPPGWIRSVVRCSLDTLRAAARRTATRLLGRLNCINLHTRDGPVYIEM